jgi:dihydroorotate dehydrogenase
VNIGKNKNTPLEEAHSDYTKLVQVFAPIADYLAINISSPNTIGLRKLQSKKYLEKLLSKIIIRRDHEAQKLNKHLPLLVKLSPDLSDDELEDAMDSILENQVDGVIATNTTIGRKNLLSSKRNETGGLSGAPLSTQSTKMIKKIHKLTDGKLPIIGVGGIMNSDDAKEKINAGAVLIQVYTGLIYKGPGLVKEIISGLAKSQ